MDIINVRVRELAQIAFAACILANPIAAQRQTLPPREIGQIINEVLRRVVPPSGSLGQVSISKRGVILDHARTMAAFGYPGTHLSPRDLGVQMPIATGSKALLADCDARGTKPCSQLGWSAYVSIEPVSIGATTAVVYALVEWADRNQAFVQGVTPTGKADLEGFRAEIHLARSANGTWKFVREGVSLVGDD